MEERLKTQIESIAENFGSEFLDIYQCVNWGISAKEFIQLLVKQIEITLNQYAKELDERNEYLE